MLAQIFQFLLETFAGFLVFLLLARFHFQWLRVPFRNQLGEFILALTNWLVLPARRLIPGLGGLDLATLLLAWMVQAGMLGVVYALRGHDFSALPGFAAVVVAGVALLDLLRFSVYLLVFALIVQAVLSWTNPYSPLRSFFDPIVRPFLRPIQRHLPLVANIDLSPLVLLIVLQVVLIPIAYGRAVVAGAL